MSIRASQGFALVALSVSAVLGAMSPESSVAKTHDIAMKAVETDVVVEGSGEKYAAWTFDGQVPGPVVRVTEGDTVKRGETLVRISNEAAQLNTENARLAAEYARVGANAEKLAELQESIELARSRMRNDSLLVVRQRNLWASQIGTRVELEPPHVLPLGTPALHRPQKATRLCRAPIAEEPADQPDHA